MNKAVEPMYKHDCEDCMFLLTEDNKDYYCCGGTLIIRYSDEPSDNSTFSVQILHKIFNKYLAEKLINIIEETTK